MDRWKAVLGALIACFALIATSAGAHAASVPGELGHTFEKGIAEALVAQAKPTIPSVPIFVPRANVGTPSLPTVNTAYPGSLLGYQACKAQSRAQPASGDQYCDPPPKSSEPAKEKCFDWVQTFSDTHKYDGNRYTFKQAFSWCGKGSVITKITYNRCWHVDGYYNYKGCGRDQAVMGTPDIQGGAGDGWVTVRCTWSYETPGGGHVMRHPHTEFKFFAHGSWSGGVTYP